MHEQPPSAASTTQSAAMVVNPILILHATPNETELN